MDFSMAGRYLRMETLSSQVQWRCAPFIIGDFVRHEFLFWEPLFDAAAERRIELTTSTATVHIYYIYHILQMIAIVIYFQDTTCFRKFNFTLAEKDKMKGIKIEKKGIICLELIHHQCHSKCLFPIK